MTDDTTVEYMLTTVDNPFNPFTQFKEWFAWDTTAGYNTPGILAHVAKVSNDLSEADETQIIQQAIDDIVKENFSGMHKKVSENDYVEA